MTGSADRTPSRSAAAVLATDALVRASPIATVAIDPDGLVATWNPAAERLLGHPAGQVLGGPAPALLADLLNAPLLVAGGVAGQDAGEVRTPLRCRDRHARVRDLEATAALVRDADGRVTGAVAMLVDVTDREQAHRRLRHQASYDSLTGLPNRDQFVDQAAQALTAAASTGAQTGLLLIDLDRFKNVNDTFGHLAGDQLLTQIGPRLLAGTLREHDQVARLAGDEFVVLLPELPGVDTAVEVAERILAALHEPFLVGGTATNPDVTSVDIVASVGVAIAPGHGADPGDLLRHADVAMYQAKQAGAGVAVYRPGRDDEHTPARFGLLGQLRRALDAGELVMHYQPKIDLATGAVHSVEALVRWQHPDRGLLPPGEFIPLAETTGLIGPLTSRVLDLALAQARAWAEAGHPLPVAVNLSARSLHDPSLPDQILTALSDHGVPAGLLWLEITETAIMHDPPAAITALTRLAEHGVGLSLDDFGTGYSSMSYLRRLPVRELKIDRSFITGLGCEHADQVLTRSTIDLGHNLGLTVVAEGVEDEPTLHALHALHCDTAQGYLIAHPMPGDQFDAWLAERPRAMESATAIS